MQYTFGRILSDFLSDVFLIIFMKTKCQWDHDSEIMYTTKVHILRSYCLKVYIVDDVVLICKSLNFYIKSC